MKKTRMLFVLVSIFMLVTACSKEENDQTKNSVQQNVQEMQGQTTRGTNGTDDEIRDNSETVVIKKSVIPKEVLERPVIDECSVDIDGDGIEEKVVLGANLWVGTDGEYEYNDGQMWSLYVVDGEEGYLIFDKYINIGRPYYQVCAYSAEKGNEMQINVITEESACFYVDGFRYSGEQGGFVKKSLYDSADESVAGISIYHSSISGYSPER